MQNIELKEALKMAAQDPNSLFSVSLKKTIESGQLDQVAQQQGIDLSMFGRPKKPKRSFAERGTGFKEQSSIDTDESFEDINQTFSGIKESIGTAQDNVADIRQSAKDGEIGKGSRMLQVAGEAASGAGSVFGEVIKGGVKLLAGSDQQEQKTKQDVSSFINKIGEVPFPVLDPEKGSLITTVPLKEALGNTVNQFKEAINWEDLNQEQRDNLVASGQIAELALEFIGGGAAKKGLGTGLETAAALGKKASDVGSDIAQSARRELDEVFAVSKNVIDDAVTPSRKISIDEAIKLPETGITKENAGLLRNTVADEASMLTNSQKRRLLGVDPDTGNKYLKILAKSEDIDNVPGVFDQAVEDTLSVISDYKKATEQVGSQIGKIKNKLKNTPITSSDKSEIKTILNDLKKKLSSDEGVFFKNGRFAKKKGKTSTFSDADIRVLNKEIVDVLGNIQKAKNRDELIIAMKALDNKINYNITGEATGSLKGISKEVRAKLKQIRDKALTKEEVGAFNKYSEAQSFIDDFAKSENKISTLLNRFSSMRSKESLEFAKELKRVTGVDVQDFAELAKILTEATSATGRNRDLLRQAMGDAAKEVITVSPTGLAGSIGQSIAKGLLDVEKLKEIKKAIDFVPTSN